LLTLALKTASFDAKLRILLQISTYRLDTRIGTRSTELLPQLFASIGESMSEWRSDHLKLVLAVMMEAMGGSNLDILTGTVDTILARTGDESKELLRLYYMVALSSAPSQLQVLLQVPLEWTAEDGYNALKNFIKIPSLSGIDCTRLLLDHLKELGICHDSVNFAGSSCDPNCNKSHIHNWIPSVFALAVRHGQFGLADLLHPYVNNVTGLPTALYHVLVEPGRRVMQAVEYLMNLDDGHQNYLCYPAARMSPLHIVAWRHSESSQCTNLIHISSGG
jgi:hypothetical protein